MEGTQKQIMKFTSWPPNNESREIFSGKTQKDLRDLLDTPRKTSKPKTLQDIFLLLPEKESKSHGILSPHHNGEWLVANKHGVDLADII